MRLTIGEIRDFAEDAKTDGGMVELPAGVVLELLNGLVELRGIVIDDYEVGE